MKYAIIIPDGAADEPLAELGRKTPFEAAHIPNMDRIAMEGHQSTARPVIEGIERLRRLRRVLDAQFFVADYYEAAGPRVN